ncbi:MAG: DJ-1/PfpI family protein, partial [Planctomycetes bacterium]|nr:DJ-1/PfpI family protein [Planctomycetota bacterium]
MLAMERYAWPGNVRELRNVLAYAYVIGEGTTLELTDLPPEIADADRPAQEVTPEPWTAASVHDPEAARIARGKVSDLASVRQDELDALVLPGGFGAAKNLSDFAVAGAEATPHPDVARLLREVHAAGKPIGAICIAPAVVAAVLGESAHPLLTIGDDAGTAQALAAM